MSRPSISVVIPSYNPGRLLLETVSSVLGQTLQPREILIVDDGSTDQSSSLAQSLSPLVRIIQQSNLGSSAARNTGIQHANGEFVALLDHDDVWHPAKLERQFELIDSRPDIVCVYCDFYRFRDGQRLTTVSQSECPQEPDYKVSMLCSCTVLPSTALLRTEVARRELFPSKYGPYAEDAIYFLTLKQHGDFLKVPEPLVGYRLSPQQQSANQEYFLHSVRARLEWLRDNAHDYTPNEFRNAVRGLVSRLIEVHDLAYWSRDMRTVRGCRKLFREVGDGVVEASRLFARPLLPRWIWKMKDTVDRLRIRHKVSNRPATISSDRK